MMKKCFNCNNYGEKYDEMCQEGDDIRERVCHHCIMYDDFIDPDIFNGEKECVYYVLLENQRMEDK